VTEVKSCPLCDGEMERGELMDADYATTIPQHWSPSASSFLGIGVRKILIVSYRCIDCGYLMNFAPSDDPKDKERYYRRKEKEEAIPNLPFGF